MRRGEMAQLVRGMLWLDFAMAVPCSPQVTEGEAWAEATQHLGPVAGVQLPACSALISTGSFFCTAQCAFPLKSRDE